MPSCLQPPLSSPPEDLVLFSGLYAHPHNSVIHSHRQTYKHILKFFRKKRNYGWIFNEMNLLTMHKSPGYHNMSIVVNSVMHWFTWEIEPIGSEVQGHLGSSRPSWVTRWDPISEREEWMGKRKEERMNKKQVLPVLTNLPAFIWTWRCFLQRNQHCAKQLKRQLKTGRLTCWHI